MPLPELERASGCPDRSLAHEDFSRPGRLLQSRRHVDRIAGDERTSLTRLPNDDLACVDADSQGKPAGEEVLQPTLHGEGGVKRPLGVIFQ